MAPPRAVQLALVAAVACLWLSHVGSVGASVDADGLEDFCSACSGKDVTSEACQKIPKVCAPASDGNNWGGDGNNWGGDGGDGDSGAHDAADDGAADDGAADDGAADNGAADNGAADGSPDSSDSWDSSDSSNSPGSADGTWDGTQPRRELDESSDDEFQPTFCGPCARTPGTTTIADPAACRASIRSTCGCDESAVASAKAAMDDCLESDPYTDAYTDAYTDGPADVCGCMDKFEAYEAALDKCGEEPSDAYEETFEDACKEDGNDDDGGNDDTCDGFLVESLALAAWKCMGSNIACTCKDQVVAYNTALEACGSDKDQTLVQLVTASCGTQADTAPASRAALCTDCPSADVLDTDPACMSAADTYCGAYPGTSFCRACEPASEHCSDAYDRTCGSCDWAEWAVQATALRTCLTSSDACACLPQYKGAEAATSGDSNDNCPDIPEYLEDHMDTCEKRGDDDCDQAAVSTTFTALKACEANNPICDCVTAFGDYAGAAKACGIKASKAVRNAFDTCDSASQCASGVGSAFNKVVRCVAVQEDHCACRQAYTEWSDLVSSCGTGGNSRLDGRFATCQQSDNGNEPSYVELTAATFTAAEADGYATVTLRRFGGAGDKGSTEGEVTLAAYTSFGRYTGLTEEVE